MSISELRRKFYSHELGKHEFIAAASRVHQEFFDCREALKGSAIRQVSITESTVVYSLREPEVGFVFDTNDARVAPIEALNFGDYEPDVRRTLCWLSESVRGNPGHIFDIGANIGWYSLILAKQFPEETFVSFEPVEPVWKALERNRQHNGLKNIRAFNLGLGEKEGTLSFVYDPHCSVASVISTTGQSGQQQLIKAQVQTLDSFCEREGVWPKLIKCDIEGAELLMLRGAKKTLAEHQPILVSEMLRKWAARFEYHPNEMISHLKGFGYQCFAIGKSGLSTFPQMQETTEETNFVFLHGQRHAPLIQRVSA